MNKSLNYSFLNYRARVGGGDILSFLLRKKQSSQELNS